jgi:hypothetical protein
MTATVFLVLLAGHLLGDWITQSDWLATTKKRSRPPSRGVLTPNGPGTSAYAAPSGPPRPTSPWPGANGGCWVQALMAR